MTENEKRTAIARIIRGLIFTMIDGAKSGHPGGSSSKVEQILSLIFSGTLAFDAKIPKHPCRDRIVWSAGHCSPLAHALNALTYETLRGEGAKFTKRIREAALLPEDLARFRTLGGPSGHVESKYAYADQSTGSSGHGLSAALGLAMLHKSCGLPTKVWCIMGDAETEEGMTYEARNIASTNQISNLVVLLDNNSYGIDGNISQIFATPIADHWKMMGWDNIRIFETKQYQFDDLEKAYENISNSCSPKPIVVINHTTKGLHYGKLENTCTSHGSPLPHDEYVAVMKELGFDVAGKDTLGAIQTVIDAYGEEERKYFSECLKDCAKNVLSEREMFHRMSETGLLNKSLADHASITRPLDLPAELVFKEGVPKATRFATEAFFKWMMEKNGLFYVGTGDLSGSILTKKAEDAHGIISPENPYGRGIRFGIAEQNMAMMMVAMSQDVLPLGLRPLTAFGTYGVFTSMMSNSVRMGLVNNAMNPKAKSCFIMLAAHDGPETGEDGPTHHGLFWMSLFMAYPGIKVYKPMDANEAVEMLFEAVRRDEPVAFSVARPNTPVFVRNIETGIPPAREAVNGAYIFKKYSDNGKPRLPIVVAGGQTAENLLKALSEIEALYDVKIIAVTSPELFAEYREKEPEKAEQVFSEEDRLSAITLHNGWKGFLDSFLLPHDYKQSAIGIDRFLSSGRPEEVYLQAGLNPKGIADKILKRQ